MIHPTPLHSKPRRRLDWRVVAVAIVASGVVGGAAWAGPQLRALGTQAMRIQNVDSTTNQSGTGQMCVFYSPGGLAGIEFGHVGWAVEDPGTAQWVLGSGDGSHGQGSSTSGNNSSSLSDGSSTSLGSFSGTSADTSPGSSSNGSSPSLSGTGNTTGPADRGVPQYNGDASKETVWVVRTATFANVLQDFQSFGWYSKYRCATTNGGDANAAYATASNDGTFSLVGNNCLNHAWKALNSYAPGVLKPAPLTPYSWFYYLGATDGFGPIHDIASGSSGGSAPSSGS
jgi:hypothetical protein